MFAIYFRIVFFLVQAHTSVVQEETNQILVFIWFQFLDYERLWNGLGWQWQITCVRWSRIPLQHEFFPCEYQSDRNRLYIIAWYDHQNDLAHMEIVYSASLLTFFFCRSQKVYCPVVSAVTVFGLLFRYQLLFLLNHFYCYTVPSMEFVMEVFFLDVSFFSMPLLNVTG